MRVLPIAPVPVPGYIFGPLQGDTRTSAAAGSPKLPPVEQLDHIVKGGQPERRVLDRMGLDVPEAFITLTLLTSLQPMVCRMPWVLRAGDRLIRKP